MVNMVRTRNTPRRAAHHYSGHMQDHSLCGDKKLRYTPVQLKSRITIVSSSTRSGSQDLLALAHELADLSAAVIKPQFRRALAVDNKAGPKAFDPVTKADQASERAIVKLIRARVPDHGIVGEEYGAQRAEAAYQ